MKVSKLKTLSTTEAYATFDQLDGTHPWQSAVPEACVMYDVRILPGGKVAYFNWDLAKEMGLVPENHLHKMNKPLEEKLLETFCIRIINEWDKAHNVVYPKTMLKKNQYMATRYLQLQHSDKTGRTSGDGRCVWNGVVRHRNQIWDVSSRGTGVTSLAPGSVTAGKPLRSGNTDHGYGCGLAEIDELYAAAIMAEIFHRNGIPTERVLTIIDLGKGVGIGVRAGHNLIRPAHLFSHLRQGQYDRLDRAVNYLIERQQQNGLWDFSASNRKRHTMMLENLSDSFAKFAAHLERDYIFAWLDWDGDNVLIDAGIIDYGSVRQFGLRHDQYRYDDIERFSTNLNEQRKKARLIVQTLAQMCDFLQTGQKRSLEHYRRHPVLKRFDKQFSQHLMWHLLRQCGLNQAQIERLLKTRRALVERFYQEFTALERIKTYRKMKRVADGINRPAIFNMRAILAKLPNYYWAHRNIKGSALVSSQELFQWMLSDFAAGKDKKLTQKLSLRLRRLQTLYKGLMQSLAERGSKDTIWLELSKRAQKINRLDRMTGNALIHVVDQILTARRKGFSDSAIQEVMNAIILDQGLSAPKRAPMMLTSSPTFQLLEQVRDLVRSHREDI